MPYFSGRRVQNGIIAAYRVEVIPPGRFYARLAQEHQRENKGRDRNQFKKRPQAKAKAWLVQAGHCGRRESQ
jgi:hypothetical protein